MGRIGACVRRVEAVFGRQGAGRNGGIVLVLVCPDQGVVASAPREQAGGYQCGGKMRSSDRVLVTVGRRVWARIEAVFGRRLATSRPF